MTIGDAVRERILMLCRERNLTINKLSMLCGVTQSTVNNTVSGRNNATVSTFKRLCDGLEITIQEFFASPLFKKSGTGNMVATHPEIHRGGLCLNPPCAEAVRFADLPTSGECGILMITEEIRR